MKSPEARLAKALSHDRARPTCINHLKDRYVVISGEWRNGVKFQFVAYITDTMSTRIPVSTREPQRKGGTPESYPDVSEWSQKQVENAGYPLYIHPGWMKEKKKHYGSWRKVADATGYSEKSLSHWARLHGFSERKTAPEMAAIKKKVLAEHAETGASRKALAKKYGVSIGSISGWLKGKEK